MSSVLRHPGMAMIFLAGVLLGGGVGFLAGCFFGNGQIYENLRRERIARVEPLLKAPEYAGLTIQPNSQGSIYLEGRIGDQADLDRLTAELRRMFGEEGAQMLSVVEVSEESRGQLAP